jgi:hypothetical protein
MSNDYYEVQFNVPIALGYERVTSKLYNVRQYKKCRAREFLKVPKEDCNTAFFEAIEAESKVVVKGVVKYTYKKDNQNIEESPKEKLKSKA